MPPPPTPGLLSGFQTPCEGSCSVTNCESGCNPSVVGSGTCSLSQCNNLAQCMSEECCREAECLEHDSVPTTRRESIDISAEYPYASSPQHQFANDGDVLPAYENSTGFDDIPDDPAQCHWLLPDQECDTTAPTKGALSQHVFNDHIQPEASFMCGWIDCEEQITPEQLTDHMWNKHHPEQHVHETYICLWDNCMEMFTESEQLGTHMEVTHTHMESIDCRWGGCGTTTTNSAELKSHVLKEHLHFQVPPALSSPDVEVGPSEGPSSLPSKRPFHWSPENDDLLMRVRAQNLTFQQIASQYFPDKSAQACQIHYAKLYYRQQESDPQPMEQSTPLLTYSPLPPVSYATGPAESLDPFVDHSLSQTSPALPLNHSGQLPSDHPPTQGDHECMWITDDAAETICGARFGHPNELQAHVESSHPPLSDIRRRRPKADWACKWMGCVRNGETRGAKDRLKKHICTHTGCKSASPIGEL